MGANPKAWRVGFPGSRVELLPDSDSERLLCRPLTATRELSPLELLLYCRQELIGTVHLLALLHGNGVPTQGLFGCSQVPFPSSEKGASVRPIRQRLERILDPAGTERRARPPPPPVRTQVTDHSSGAVLGGPPPPGLGTRVQGAHRTEQHKTW